MTWPSNLRVPDLVGRHRRPLELHAHPAQRRHGLRRTLQYDQYAVLIHLIAQSAGLRPGLFTHVINNAHIYENHVEAMKTQLARRDQAMDAPKLILNSDIHDFYGFTPDDIRLDDYQHLGKLSMEVAV